MRRGVQEEVVSYTNESARLSGKKCSFSMFSSYGEEKRATQVHFMLIIVP